jgi:hypothetical protein
MPRTSSGFRFSPVITAALLATACATPPDAVPVADGVVRTSGTVASIDTQPWAYDGHAVVQVDTADRGRVDVQLPARWNLCKATQVDVEALAVGMQVQVVAAAAGEGALVVCGDAAHRLVPVDAAPSRAGAGGDTVGGDGSAITLAPLTAGDIEGASLAGELACGFSAAPGGAPLLLAKGHVASDAPARGVVKVGDYLEPVAAPGGFDGMLRGARFSGAGKVVLVELTGPATQGGESPPSPATLTYHRADGARRTFAGQWQCGP